jgi:hypothetical protein
MKDEKTNGTGPSPAKEPVEYIEWTEIEINGVRVDVPKELAGLILEQIERRRALQQADEH